MSQLLVNYLITTIILINLSFSYGLICYNCTTTDPLHPCAVNNGNPVRCTARYCILYQVESSDTQFFLYRGCQDLPTPPGTISRSENHEQKIIFRYCTADFCNGGDGKGKVSRPVINVEGIKPSTATFLSPHTFSLIFIIISNIWLISK